MKKVRLLLTGLFLVMAVATYAQSIQVTGTVTDAGTGDIVPYASIQIKGTSTGTATDDLGNYSINVLNNGTLVFSFIGYTAQDVPVNGKNVINVTLESEAESLDDVIVVAYGTAKRSSLTGSAAVINQKQIENITTNNFTKALEGTVAGVQVTTGSGQPGSDASIRIRGIGSVNASNAPLYIVDGAAYDGDINAIATEDIQSISILKDAASAALYGARGANGVIIVTTKQGRSGETIVNAKINIGTTSRAVAEYDRVTTSQWYEQQWEGIRNWAIPGKGYTIEQANVYASENVVSEMGGYNPYNVSNAELIGTDGKLNPNATLLYQDDWNKALSQPGLRQDYSISISGGSDKTTYYSSISYLNEMGHVKWSSYDRLNARVGVTSQITDWFKAEVGLSGNTSGQEGFLAEGTYTSNPFYYGRIMGPVYPIYQRDAEGNVLNLPDGTPAYDIGDGGKSNQYAWTGHKRPYAPNSNLMLTLPLDERGNTRNQLSARAAAEFHFLKDFTFKVSGNTDIYNQYETTYQNNLYGDAESVGGRSTKEYQKTMSYTFTQLLTYHKEFDNHNFGVLLGHENYSLEKNNLLATRTGFKFDGTSELVAGAVAEGSSSYSNYYTLEGYFGQLNYSYANKYFVSGSFRYDGTSRFAADTRWGSFWSAGASWRIKQEDFIKYVSWLDDLKLKISYGEQGNDAILNSDGEPDYYGYQPLFSISDTNNGLLQGSWFTQLANPDLKWEKNANLNTGLEFSLWGRLRGNIEYFMRKSNNLLFSVPIPESSGIASQMKNIGTMANNGVEITLSGDVIQTEKFNWNMSLNLTHYKNKITKTPLDSDGNYQEIISGSKKISVGHSIYDFWLRDFAGVDPANGDALYYMDIEDAEGNITGKGTTNNRNLASYYYVGSAIPDLYGGFTNSLSFYGVDLSILLTFQIGGKMYDGSYASLMHAGSFGQHWSTDILNAWTSENTNTDVPRVEYNNPNLSTVSSRFLTNASYLSIRNVTLGYTIPQKIIQKIGFKGVRVYLTGDNLHLFSARKGMDSQQSFTGVSDFTYVPTRTLSVGLNITF